MLPEPQALKAEPPVDSKKKEEEKEDVGEARSPIRPYPPPQQGGIANFLGLRLPELPSISLPFFSGSSPSRPPPPPRDLKSVVVKTRPEELAALKERVKSEAIPISLGKKPEKDALEVRLILSSNESNCGR